MTVMAFIERVIIPTLVMFLLAGGVAGTLLGLALVYRSATALAFIARMNRWVSTRQALEPLESPRRIEPSAATRRWLGVFLVGGGALAVVFLLMRLDFTRPFAPAVNITRWFLSGVALQAMKWVLIVGSVFSLVVGALMIFAPERLAELEARLNTWYSSPRLIAAEETMLMPLEPRVEAHPRAAGWLIAGASLAVTLAMVALVLLKLR